MAVIRPLPVQATGEYWLEDWSYRKSHVVLNSTGAGTDYQMKFLIKNGTNGDSANTVNLAPGQFRSDFGDIRFTTGDGQTLLYAWPESLYPNENTTVWVKITDDLSTVNSTMYLYYGKPTATAYWDGPNTFLFFDDFPGTSLNNSQWITLGTATTVQVQNSLMNMTGAATYDWKSGYHSNTTASKIQYGRWVSNCSIPSVTSPGTSYFMFGLQAGWDPNSNDNNETQFYTSGATTMPFIRNLTTTYTTAAGFTKNAFSIKSLTWNNSLVALWDNATTSVVNVTAAVPKNCYMNVSFQCYSTIGTLWVDWVFLTKFSYPEPSHNSWGSVESPAPLYDATLLGTNTTLTVRIWLFYSFWYVVTGANLSGFIFSFNASGIFENDTWTTFSSANNSWANVTKEVSNGAGTTLAWQVLANDTNNFWAALPLQYVIATATITVYFWGSGQVERNGTLISNGTAATYNQQNTGLAFSALPSANVSFMNFTWTYASTVNNPFNFSVVNCTEIWAYFGNATGGFSRTRPEDLAGLLIGGLILVLALIVVLVVRRRK